MTAKRDYGYDKWLDKTPAEWALEGKRSSTNFPNYLPKRDDFSDVRSDLEWEATYWDITMEELAGISIDTLIDPSLSDNPLRGSKKGCYNNRVIDAGVMHVIDTYGHIPSLPRLTAWLSAAGYERPKGATNSITIKNVETAVKRVIASGFCMDGAEEVSTFIATRSVAQVPQSPSPEVSIRGYA